MYVLSRCSCVQLFATPCQSPLSMRFSRQEYRSGLPCPPPGDLSDPGIEPMSLLSPAWAGGFFSTNATWEANTPSRSREATLPAFIFSPFGILFQLLGFMNILLGEELL